MNQKKGFFRPWMFVVLGVLMTISSAVLTQWLMAQKGRQLMALQAESVRLEQQIEQHWQQAKSLEYEEHIGTIILLFSDLTASKDAPAEKVQLAMDRYVEKILLSGRLPLEKSDAIRAMMKEKGGATEALKSVFEVVDKHRVETVETINGLYTQKQAAEQREASLREQMSFLSMLALFLQVMGLILVLAKDLVQPSSAGQLSGF